MHAHPRKKGAAFETTQPAGTRCTPANSAAAGSLATRRGRRGGIPPAGWTATPTRSAAARRSFRRAVVVSPDLWIRVPPVVEQPSMGVRHCSQPTNKGTCFSSAHPGTLGACGA